MNTKKRRANKRRNNSRLSKNKYIFPHNSTSAESKKKMVREAAFRVQVDSDAILKEFSCFLATELM